HHHRHGLPQGAYRKRQAAAFLHGACKLLPTCSCARLLFGGSAPIFAPMADIIIRRGLAEPDTSASFTPHTPLRPEKSEGGKRFILESDYSPAGDQPAAIKDLV